VGQAQERLHDSSVRRVVDQRRSGRVHGDPELATEDFTARARMRIETSSSPRSIRQITDRATPIAPATRAWLTPDRNRSARISSPNRTLVRRSWRSPSLIAVRDTRAMEGIDRASSGRGGGGRSP
jgi:hypothetical protein